MYIENSDNMKAISESRVKVAIRSHLQSQEKVFATVEEAVAAMAKAVMAAGVEIQRPDTVLKSEYDLVVAKNQTLVQLMELMTVQLNAKPNSSPTAKTDHRSGASIPEVGEC